MSFISEEYYDRELSWLRFNHRVLQEAADHRNPLYERIKFIAIYSANLDEFFKVRVSDIRQIKHLDKPLRKKLITKPNKLLRRIKKEVDRQGNLLGKIWTKQIKPALKAVGIDLIDLNSFDERQRSFCKEFYQSFIKGQIDIIENLNSEEDQLRIENEKLYLISLDRDQNLLIVNIPESADRFVAIPGHAERFTYTFIDDIIKCALEHQLGIKFYSIKVSRDAELYLGDEYSGNLLEKIKNSLPKRHAGQVTRALVEGQTPVHLIDHFMLAMDINHTDLVIGGTHHNLSDFHSFPNPIGDHLKLPELPPRRVPDLDRYDSILSAIEQRDRLLYFPYHSFEYVLNLVEEAANDPMVKLIKITLYRISKDSMIAKALLKALENGKEVFAFIETKARFDEANNIAWGQKLHDHGAQVIYSYPGIKVHSKIMYIERIDQGVKTAYAYIGTGNFNEKTARIYSDFSLMTVQPQIAQELLQVFQVIEKKIIIPQNKRLLVSPFSSRERFRELVQNEINNSLAGKVAYMILKMNSLQDPEMIQKLYEANNAGVRIQLIIRGICCLVPGVEGQSERISAISIIDRYLEHARVYIFANGGREKMFIGSADWMTRNLDHRIEVLAPISDPDHFATVRNLIQLQLDDQTKSRIIDKKQRNKYVSKTSQNSSAQVKTYHSLDESKLFSSTT